MTCEKQGVPISWNNPAKVDFISLVNLYVILPQTKFPPVAVPHDTLVGADGVMVEVHHNPSTALSDGKQSLSIPQFKEVFARLNNLIDTLHLEKSMSVASMD